MEVVEYYGSSIAKNESLTNTYLKRVRLNKGVTTIDASKLESVTSISRSKALDVGFIKRRDYKKYESMIKLN